MLSKKRIWFHLQMQEILIYGAGGHAKVVIDTVLREGKYTIIGLVDDGEVAPAVLGFQVFKRLEEVPSKPSNFIVAIGDNKTRKQKFEKLKEAGWKPATIVHPTAVISEFARIGEGSLICLKANINTDARVGDNVIINSGANVEHECNIGSTDVQGGFRAILTTVAYQEVHLTRFVRGKKLGQRIPIIATSFPADR